MVKIQICTGPNSKAEGYSRALSLGSEERHASSRPKRRVHGRPRSRFSRRYDTKRNGDPQHRSTTFSFSLSSSFSFSSSTYEEPLMLIVHVSTARVTSQDIQHSHHRRQAASPRSLRKEVAITSQAPTHLLAIARHGEKCTTKAKIYPILNFM